MAQQRWQAHARTIRLELSGPDVSGLCKLEPVESELATFCGSYRTSVSPYLFNAHLAATPSAACGA